MGQPQPSAAVANLRKILFDLRAAVIARQVPVQAVGPKIVMVGTEQSIGGADIAGLTPTVIGSSVAHGIA